jgi:hypothetical protein
MAHALKGPLGTQLLKWAASWEKSDGAEKAAIEATFPELAAALGRLAQYKQQHNA